MTDSILPANPLDVDQVNFDNALIASGRDKVMEDRRWLYEHKFIDEQGDPIPLSPPRAEPHNNATRQSLRAPAL